MYYSLFRHVGRTFFQSIGALPPYVFEQPFTPFPIPVTKHHYPHGGRLPYNFILKMGLIHLTKKKKVHLERCCSMRAAASDCFFLLLLARAIDSEKRLYILTTVPWFKLIFFFLVLVNQFPSVLSFFRNQNILFLLVSSVLKIFTGLNCSIGFTIHDCTFSPNIEKEELKKRDKWGDF